ncbi:MAG: 4Fe-4S dicluster domain-containing protein, partial [Woeseia sp.]
MYVDLPTSVLSRRDGGRAIDILRRCVHCGICNATCPTYQITGNELDGPRGRIYLIKGVLETG